jgi:copper chaperone
MENKQLQFKTNINCAACVASVSPQLDQAEAIAGWQVDTTDKNKILTVQSGTMTAEQVVALVQKAGFKAEALAANQ